MTHVARMLRLLLVLGGLCAVLGLNACAGPPRRSVFGTGEKDTQPPAPVSREPFPPREGPAPSGSAVVRSAEGYLGTPYRYGGSTRAGLDCSGLVLAVFAEHGIAMPRSCAAQSRRGSSVARSQLRAGDLVFFGARDAPPSHVGIYVGEGRFIHASTSRREVRRDALSTVWFRDHYRGARRVLPSVEPVATEGS